MSSLLCQNGIWYYVWYPRPGAPHRRKSTKTRDKVQARRIQKQWDAMAESNRLGLSPTRCQVEQSIEEFMARKETTLKSGTMVRYREIISRIVEFLKDQDIKYWHHLGTDHVDEYVRQRQGAGLSAKTIDDEMSLLRGILRWLWQEKKISELPIRRWPMIKVVARNPERLGFYQADEIERLKEYFSTREFRVVFLAEIFTGARREELRSSRVRDFRGGVLMLRQAKVDGHADAYRPIPVHPDLVPFLEERCKGKPLDDLIFPEMQRHSRDWPAQQMTKACEALGIPYRRFHGLRHSVATLLLAGGMDVARVGQIMGHKRIETTQRYTHATRIRAEDMKKLGY